MNTNTIMNYYNNKNELDLEKIIKDYSPYIGTIITNMSKGKINSDDMEEIISDVFFIIWNNKEKIDAEKKLSSYIAGITKNLVKVQMRKSRLALDISDYENKLFDNNEIEIYDKNIDKIHAIEKSLEKLKDRDKKIFIDFYYSSKSIKDIAKEETCSEFAIKQKLYRIRNKIKKEIKKYES